MNARRNSLERWGLDTRFLLWMACLTLGFAYVAGVINGRANPFHSRDGGYETVARVLVVGGLLYFAGPRKGIVPLTAVPAVRTVVYTLFFLVPFVFGLHFYYGQQVTGLNLSLTAHGLRRLDGTGWMALGGLVFAVSGLVFRNLQLARRAGYGGWYGLTLVGAILVVALVSWLVRETHYVHIHHYNAAGFFLPWLRFRHPMTLVALGLCTGVFVEGATTWGMDPVWNPR